MARSWCRHCSAKGVCRRTRRGFWRKLSSCDTCLVQAGVDPAYPRILTCSVCLGTAVISEERLKQLVDEVDRGNNPIFIGDKLKEIKSNGNNEKLLGEGQDI